MTLPQSAKFIFQDYGKIVTLDLPNKVVFDDLKMSFTRMLNVNFFAKKLEFYLPDSNYPIDSSRTLGEVIGQTATNIVFIVKIGETGA